MFDLKYVLPKQNDLNHQHIDTQNSSVSKSLNNSNLHEETFVQKKKKKNPEKFVKKKFKNQRIYRREELVLKFATLSKSTRPFMKVATFQTVMVVPESCNLSKQSFPMERNSK